MAKKQKRRKITSQQVLKAYKRAMAEAVKGHPADFIPLRAVELLGGVDKRLKRLVDKAADAAFDTMLDEPGPERDPADTRTVEELERDVEALLER